MNERGRNFNVKQRNRIDGIYDCNWIALYAKDHGRRNHGHIAKPERLLYRIIDENRSPVNTSLRKISAVGDNRSYYWTALYRKRFNKQGRTLSVYAKQNYLTNKPMVFY